MSTVLDLQAKIKELLPDLECVIGWKQGFDPLHATPHFMRTEADVDSFIFNPLCVHNPSTYLPSLKGKKVGIVVKGCDSRSVIELLQENLINREDVVIFGMPCAGVVDVSKINSIIEKKGLNPGRIESVEADDKTVRVVVADEKLEMPFSDVAAPKCSVCRYHNAIECDHFFGDPLPATVENDDYADVAAIESMALADRFAMWNKEMERCIRCYACRNACPMCVCRDHCVAQSRDPHWLTQEDAISEKLFFQLIHAFHLAGRCTECGECQRACPVNIPILTFKRKINKELKEIFDYSAGVDLEAKPPLLAFKVEEENINERGW